MQVSINMQRKVGKANIMISNRITKVRDMGMISTTEQKLQSARVYKEAIKIMHTSGANFMLGGESAMFRSTGIFRDTKDLDIFCKPSEYPTLLKHFANHGYRVELTDVRWLAKVFKDDYFIDIIFDTVNNICRVDDSWYRHAPVGHFEGLDVNI